MSADKAAPKNLRSSSQAHKDSPSAKKASDKARDKNSDKMTDKGAEKPAKDLKQASITDYQVEGSEKSAEKSSEALVLKEIKKFNTEVKSLFDDLEKKMDKGFKAMDEKFTKLYSGLEKEVNQLKQDMTDSKTEIENTNRKVADLQKEFDKSLGFETDKREEQLKKVNEKMAEKFKEGDDKLMQKFKEAEESLDKKITELDNKLKLLEKHDRKYNLLFYGIPEEAGEDPIDKLRNLFVNDLKIDMTLVHRMQFIHCHRVPSKGKGPKPIILRFLSYQDRELVLNNANLLAGSKRRILVDLPNSMKTERDRLAKIAYNIRHDEELKTRFKDKGLEVYLEVRKDNSEKWKKRAV